VAENACPEVNRFNQLAVYTARSPPAAATLTSRSSGFSQSGKCSRRMIVLGVASVFLPKSPKRCQSEDEMDQDYTFVSASAKTRLNLEFYIIYSANKMSCFQTLI
jgi:hypothetical protein